MPLYVVTYIHPNEKLWLEHLEAHLFWIEDHLKDGSLVASGPLENVEEKSALLVLLAENPEHVDEIVSSDPYVSQGLVTTMTVVEWAPIFGALAKFADGSS